MNVEVLKWLHVVSAIVLVGGGLGSAFHLFATSLGRKPQQVTEAARNVLRSDAAFTIPSAVFQLASGLWLADRLGVALQTPWLRWSLIFYAVVVAIWVPVIWLELRMRAISAEAAARSAALPRRYWACFLLWSGLGVVGFGLFAAIVWLMVLKTVPWSS